MDEKKSQNEYENIKSEDISKQLENITNTQSHRKVHIRTFAKDVAEQMKNDSASVVKVALAEQGRQREYETIVKHTKKQQILFLVLSFILFVGGSIIVAFILRNNTTPIELSQSNQQEGVNSIVFSEQQMMLDVTNLSRSEFITTIMQRVDFIRESGLTNLILTVSQQTLTRTVYGSEFITLVASNIPQTILPLIQNNFMFGIDGNNNFSIFIIMSFDDFDSFVDGMRTWEPFFVQDMARILEIQTNGDIELFSKSFNSEILFNKEARVLRDRNQGFVVGYVFLDRETVLFSTHIDSIQEIINRYTIQSIY